MICKTCKGSGKMWVVEEKWKPTGWLRTKVLKTIRRKEKCTSCLGTGFENKQRFSIRIGGPNESRETKKS